MIPTPWLGSPPHPPNPGLAAFSLEGEKPRQQLPFPCVGHPRPLLPSSFLSVPHSTPESLWTVRVDLLYGCLACLSGPGSHLDTYLPQKFAVRFGRQMCAQAHNKTACGGLWDVARSLEGWLAPQQGLKSSRFPSWRSHLDGRQRLLPSVSLLPVSGWPTSNPSYRGPRLSAEDDLDLPPGCCPTL